MTASGLPANENVVLAIEDGTTMQGYVARPKTAARSPRGIIIFHEAFGLNDHIRELAERFANVGFTALAPDLFHRTSPGPLGYDDMRAPVPHVDAVTVDTLGPDVRAVHKWLAEAGGVGKNIVAIGYCMGGRVTFIANALVKLKAAAVYYGNIYPELLPLAEQQQAPLMTIWGGMDKFIPAERTRAVVEALASAKKEHDQVIFSDGDHGFFNDARPSSYNAEAARLAWVLTNEFFRMQLGD